MSFRLLAVLSIASALGADAARAAAPDDVERFAVVIGHNVGEPGQQELSYAEDDAAKIHAVLRDFGAYPPEHIVLLRGNDANTVRRALIDVNDRIRARSSAPGVETSLLVYYSGHADGGALQLGGSRLPIVEFEKLVRGSPAGFRLLVVDACRSGTLTRVKGGRAAPPLVIEMVDRSPNEGVVFLTAASADEDAQESDELRGSFFTHYLVSGLLGAADANRDGQIVLDEAYRYAYEHTLRASSRTLAGTQHPTFRYEFKGRGDVVLTDLRGSLRRSALVFPKGRSYLVFHDDRHGRVVGEIGAADEARQLHLGPGRYFIRGRGSSFLLEGEISVKSGERRSVEDAGLERIEYARLVRKGRGPQSTHGPQAGLQVRTPLAGGAGPCLGGFVGWGLDLRHVSFLSRLGACRGERTGSLLRETADEFGVELRAALTWDLPAFSVELAVVTGGSLFRQSFSTAGLAPERWAGAVNVGAVAGIQREVAAGFYLQADAGVHTYFLRQQASRPEGKISFINASAIRTSLAAGRRW